MMNYTDITVRTANPAMLDETVQQLGPAVVVEDSWNGDTCTMRIYGDPGFIIFAIKSQGYGEVLESGQT
jgi:hypothetical protein